MPTRPALFAFFALFALPAAAAAGPIEFNYTATGNAFYLYPTIPSSHLSFNLTPGGNVSLPEPGGSVDLGTIRLTPGSVPYYSLLYPFQRPTGPTSAFTTFAVFVTVTDTQGRSTELPLYGSTDERWVPGPGEDEWVTVYSRIDYGTIPFFGGPPYFGENMNSRTIVLGSTEYTLTGRATENDLVGVYTLSAAPAPVSTPEPGTLALAALGLIPFGVRGLRRKW